MVGIHVLQVPNLSMVGIVANGTKRTIALTFLFSCSRLLGIYGFRGKEYNANSVGKAMRKLGFDSRMIRGTRKYLVTKIDPNAHEQTSKLDVCEFVPKIC